jgi:hypothetical protein
VRIGVVVHGMLTAAVREPGGEVQIEVPDGVDIKGLVEILSEQSPLFDPRSCLAVVDAVRVPLDRVLVEGEQVHLYLMFGGG